VLRVVEWRNLNEQERMTFCARGLADIFDPALRASIAELIDDVRTNGDDAVCRALKSLTASNFERTNLSSVPMRSRRLV